MGSNVEEDPVDVALAALRGAITERVRSESMRDHLTGLGNQLALKAEIETRIRAQRAFWIAFVEVNRFKSVNDRFGYDNANSMLTSIADALSVACKFYFVGRPTPFRAHGDEFFLMCELDGVDIEAVRRGLEATRNSIAALRVETPSGVMDCTVSVGFLQSTSLVEQRYRSVMDGLERAMCASKKDRFTVCSFDDASAQPDFVTVRDDCGRCATKWTMDLDRKKALDEEQTWCPNCGFRADRPPMPEAPVSLPTIFLGRK